MRLSESWKDTVLISSNVCRHILYAAVSYLNFTPIVSLPSDGGTYGNPYSFPNFGGILGDIFQNRSDLSVVFSGADTYVNQQKFFTTNCIWRLTTNTNTNP